MSEVSQQGMDEGIQKLSAPFRYRVLFFVLLVVGVCFLGMAAVLQYTTPSYSELIYPLNHEEAVIIAAELQNNNISYRYEQTTGAISVLSADLQYARIKLAAKGLLQNSEKGIYFPGINNDRSPISGAKLQESPHQVLETELAKSIASFDYVKSARIHLVLSNADSNKTDHVSRASVVVRLYPGRRLTEVQVSSISHLIAASVANLSLDNITIIDQSGKLLKSADSTNSSNLTTAQFHYARQLEQSYVDRIESILAPILGTNSIRAQVAVEIDTKNVTSDNQQTESIHNNLQNSVAVNRLLATVIVDNRMVEDAEGQLIRVARNDEEMERITDLVKHAIGYNIERGDNINVINEPFNIYQANKESLVNNIWPVSWFNNSLWYLIIGITTLFISVVVLKMLRTDINATLASAEAHRIVASSKTPLIDEQQAKDTDNELVNSNGVGEKTPFEQSMLKARQLVREDPKIVAQIVKNWVKEGG